MTERATTIPPKIKNQIGIYTRAAFNRGPYDTNGGQADMATLTQMGLVVTGSYPNVSEVRRYDASCDTWESVPVCSRIVRTGPKVITIFEPTTEIPKNPTR